MAQFGAKRPVFAPIKTTPDGALPTYDYEKKVTIGKLVKADLTVTNASGELYGDDALAEKSICSRPALWRWKRMTRPTKYKPPCMVRRRTWKAAKSRTPTAT